MYCLVRQYFIIKKKKAENTVQVRDKRPQIHKKNMLAKNTQTQVHVYSANWNQVYSKAH